MSERFAATLSERDLNFIIRTVATERKDYENIARIVRDKPDLIDLMLDDEKLFRRVISHEDILLEISPRLLFEILLRRAHKELRSGSFTLERVGITQKIPVFDSDKVIGLLSDRAVKDYLADMLSSFTRVNSTSIYFKVGNRFYRRSYSDMDIDDMIELSNLVEEESRFPFYKRIGDIALFLIGIFPEHVLSGYPRRVRSATTSRKRRSLEDYENEGARFYQLAAEYAESKATNLSEVLLKLSQNFTLAKKPLNFIAERYIQRSKFKWFASSI